MKNFFIIYITLVFGLFSNTGFAIPEPLGIVLTKTSYEEVVKKFPKSGEKIGPAEGYYIMELNIENIKIDSIKQALVYFNDKDICEAVVMLFNKKKFNDITDTLKEKYTLQSSKIPFVGDKFATYRDDDFYIKIESIHLANYLSLLYSSSKFVEDLEMHEAKERQDKKESEKKLL